MAVRFKIKRNGVHAKPFMGWWWPVIKDVAKVGTASCTNNFRAFHTSRVVGTVDNTVLSYRLKKTWPATTAGKFCLRPE